ncbi:M1 family metallopeptidase [Granulicella tundricola]|uniref:Aminopeptidase N n=1 Tax=Granulicella tundricola (strain ATCC BAA-1859 / DSM 23138 / MP5ACTX9) TaxID=1198114 RepID=E8X6D3_GRATM|nr:M1 family metallopeptidase [Granulicella tundricola]ADW71017.1 Peptidase M1 membrane alanine aminopeptidase [Granulicella tundricola MP5ACTX9]
MRSVMLGLVVCLCAVHGLTQGRRQANAAGPHVFGDLKVEQYAPSRSYHVENYKVTARIDMEKGEIFGDEVVTLRPLGAGLKSFYLDSSQLQIDHVTLKGAALPFHLDGDKLWVTLDRGYSPADALDVRIVYHGNPQGRPFPDAGLSFIRPDAVNPKRPLEVWSYGWPQNNHFWFPCWDYPNDKSTSEVILTVPEPLSVVSNGALVKETHANGLATYDWAEQVPHSVYLVSIAVGPWTKYSQRYGSKAVDYYVPPGVDEATALRSFGLTPEMMAFYSKIYGVDYPYEKYAQTADHAFGGGTENISATSLAETTLHDARAEQDFPSLDLVSHELAHQWFGDLITEWSWDDAWLSEGFATFSAALYRGHHEGYDAFRYQIYEDQQTAMREDIGRYRRPIVDRHYTKPWEILDRTTYQKGAAVLDMLRYVMNDGVEKTPTADEPYFRALQAYLTAYRAGNVDTQNLIDMIRKTTGLELSWFFDEWVFKGGYPEYEVSTAYDSARRDEAVTVRQTQTVDAVTPLFDMPVHLVFHGAHGERQDEMERVHQLAETFHVTVGWTPVWVEFDPNDHIYKTLKIAEPVEALVARGERGETMMSRLWAAEQLGLVKGEGGKAAEEALMRMLERDSYWGVRVASAKALGSMGGEPAKSALLLALKQPNSHVRTAAVQALGQFAKDAGVRAMLMEHMRDDDSYAVEAMCARTLGSSGGAEALTALEAEVAVKPSHYVMAGVLEGLSHYKDATAQAIVMEQTKTGSTDEVREMAAFALTKMKAAKD